MTCRDIVRAAVLPAAIAPVVAVASPAAAFTPEWDKTGLTSLQMAGIFIGIPIALFVVISLLFVLIPELVSNARNRQGPSWQSERAWFGGPEDEQQSFEVSRPSERGGGASGRW